LYYKDTLYLQTTLKHFLNISFLVLLSFFIEAQTDSVYTGAPTTARKNKEQKDKKQSDLKDKLFYGGNLNVLFVRGASIINFNPTVGYMVTDKFHVGAGFMITYYSVRFLGQNVSAAFYGPHTFARYFITDGIYLQTQYDRLYQPKYNSSKGNIEQGWVDYLLVGGGFRRKVGAKTYLVSSIMYNLNFKPNQISAYYNPMIQFGIIGGF
jgi:hypothetical protein